MTIEWKLEKRQLKDLKDHPKNPRRLSKEDEAHLKVSLEKFGLIDKPIINQDNMIIGGHQRKRVLQKQKVKEIECFVPNRLLSEKEVDELNIRLNKNTGDFDFDILANEWEITDLVEWGFTANELIDEKDEKDSNIKEDKLETNNECPNCGYILT